MLDKNVQSMAQDSKKDYQEVTFMSRKNSESVQCLSTCIAEAAYLISFAEINSSHALQSRFELI